MDKEGRDDICAEARARAKAEARHASRCRTASLPGGHENADTNAAIGWLKIRIAARAAAEATHKGTTEYHRFLSIDAAIKLLLSARPYYWDKAVKECEGEDGP